MKKKTDLLLSSISSYFARVEALRTSVDHLTLHPKEYKLLHSVSDFSAGCLWGSEVQEDASLEVGSCRVQGALEGKKLTLEGPLDPLYNTFDDPVLDIEF